MNSLPEYWVAPGVDEEQFRITIIPPKGETELDGAEINAFRRWLRDTLDGYVGAIRIETDF